MTEQTKEQAYQQIIEELFSIVDHATLNIAKWPQVDALQARYRALQQEQSEDGIWYQDDWISKEEPTDSPGYEDGPDDEEQARIEEYLRKEGLSIDTPINLSATSATVTEPPEMYYCEHCGQHHPLAGRDWLCPLDPAYRDGWSDKLADRGY